MSPLNAFTRLVIGVSLLAACGRKQPSEPSTVMAPPKASSPAPIAPTSTSAVQQLVLSSLVRGGNTEITWSCGIQASRWGDPQDRHDEVNEGWFSDMEGTLVWDPVQVRVEALEWSVGVASCQEDGGQSLYGMRVPPQWFDASKFPRAFFKAQRVQLIQQQTAWMTEYTHRIHGTLTLNGIAKEMTMLARIIFGKEGVLRMDAHLDIPRQDFKMGFIGAGSDGRDAAGMDTTVRLSFRMDAAPAVAQLAERVQAQRGAVRQLKKDLAWSRFRQQEDRQAWADRLTKVEAATAFLRQAAAPQLCAQGLPAKFEDVLVYPAEEKDYEVVDEWTGNMRKLHYSYAGRRTPFTMVLVPGDSAKGIAPFYMGETEVSWDLFHHWSHWYDAPMHECRKEEDAGLRPSNADSYSDTSHNDKRYDGYPALGMSRLAAERFCEMLSKRTGRHYRLPTEAEWDRAYALGGGDPVTEDAKKEVAWCKENAELTPESYDDAPGKTAAKKPNTLGLYDMLGNVAEWVETPGLPDREGKNTFVRGGDFKTPLKDLAGARREESFNMRLKDGSWNKNYPNEPTSKWWYTDHYQIGFRLVCEPVNLP